MQFRISIARDDKTLPQQDRTIERDFVADAADAALRWLRLTWNTADVADSRYNRWLVSQHHPVACWTVIASGDMSQPRAE